ncbi:MAG: sulfite exporter TauE/SafE family protein [Giesbergeria sp.]|uniref:sulfite exporter TauE/SafE family protein n=1 Tax=Giesbergeria sp. TaxID=2818473 RepID=UPI0026042047|nr:sulfite exporter TauE/SafE family protein [Giesbergeria sp.]MDD2608150.1 sulfite exporter TauE/SafE family protein [Giesbergeria sp.]
MWPALPDALLLLAAAFGAGALNAVAGGGSFLTLPALVWTGAPPVVANATGTVALLPGYLASVWGQRQDMQAPPGLSLWAVALLSLLGGALGAGLLLLTPHATFSRIVPWLLLLATALFAFGPWLRQWASGTAGTAGAAPRWRVGVGLLAVGVYGGYFNGGLGILLLAFWSLCGAMSLHQMNALKNGVSALLAAIAVAVYAAGGVVQWPQALLMMLAATAGGYTGARLARRIPVPWLRAGIVLTGLAMAALFFARG